MPWLTRVTSIELAQLKHSPHFNLKEQARHQQMYHFSFTLHRKIILVQRTYRTYIGRNTLNPGSLQMTVCELNLPIKTLVRVTKSNK
jgi:hypothetical protein